MKFQEYKELCRELNSLDDVNFLSSKYNLTKDALLNILSQRIVRSATARYYKIKAISSRLLETWLKGKSFCQIAEELNFPPVLTASLILQQYGISKRRFWKYLLHLELVKEERVRKELLEVCEKDWVYSPKALEGQRARGKELEDFVDGWLEKKCVSFQRENELRKKYRKTPDFLLGSKLVVNNWKINWIECKASFGDYVEIKRNARKQFLPYRKQFGAGLVIYWHGYLEDFGSMRDVLIRDKEFF